MFIEEMKACLTSTLDAVLVRMRAEAGVESGPSRRLEQDLTSVADQQVPILLMSYLQQSEVVKRLNGLTNHPSYSSATKSLLGESAETIAELLAGFEIDLSEQIEIAERNSEEQADSETVELDGEIVGHRVSKLVGDTIEAICGSVSEYGPKLVESEFKSIETLSLYQDSFDRDHDKWEQATRDFLKGLDLGASDTVYGWLGSNLGVVSWESFLGGFSTLSDISDFVLPKRAHWIIMMFEGETMHYGIRK